MNRLPPWIRSSTRPTSTEVERLIGDLDPELVNFARDATAPRPSEIAALRRRKPKRSVHPSLTAFAVVVVTAAAIGLMVVEPELLEVTERAAEPGIYLVTTADDLSPIHGVWIRGEGAVEVEADGRLVLDGDLLLTVTAPVVFEVDDHVFSAQDAVVWVDGTGLRIASGHVNSEMEELTAGERWSPPVVAVEVVPEAVPFGPPAPVPAVEPVAVAEPVDGEPDAVVEVEPVPVDVPPVPVPEVAPEVPAAPPEVPTAPPAALGWRDVLVRLEQGGTTDDRLAALRSYRARYPDSPFDPEAEALMLLIRGTDGDPRERLGTIERWLGRHPQAARSVELHGLAARIAREQLMDCGRAEPHDRVVVGSTTGATRAKGQAFLGLCAIASGRPDEGRELLADLDLDLLDPTLKRAVAEARNDEPKARGGKP